MHLNPGSSNYGFPFLRGHGSLALALTLLLSPSFSASVHSQAISEQIIGWSATSISGISLNDSGHAVWASGHGIDSQVFYWDGTAVQSIGFSHSNNRDPQINNNGIVVFSAFRQSNTEFTTDIYSWKGSGIAADISSDADVSAQPRINNHNQIVYGAQVGGSGVNDVVYRDPISGNSYDLTQYDYVGASAAPTFNNNGVVTWERSTAVNPGGETNLISSTISTMMGITDPNDYTSNIHQVTHRNDLNLINAGINDLGKMVWVAYNDAAGKWDVWENDPNGSGKNIDLTWNIAGDSFDPKITEDGTVVWYTLAKNGSHSEIYWNHGFGSKLISLDVPYFKNSPISINNNGTVLYASGNGTSTGYNIIEAHPLPDGSNVPEPASLVFMLSAGAAGMIMKLKRKR